MSAKIPEDIRYAAEAVTADIATQRFKTSHLVARAILTERQSHSDAIAAKDREIAELRADCVRKDDLLLAAVQDYNDVRQRTIEECAKVADEAEVELFEYPSELAGEYYRSGGVDASVGIAVAIRSLGKEGSGE